MAYLDTALSNVTDTDALTRAACDAARNLNWGQVYGGGGMDEKLADGMFACQAAGTYGCFEGRSVATGLFLLTPDIHYPLHTHAAPEVYYCVSGTIDIQHGVGQAPFALTPGNYSVTPSNRVHALTTRDDPVILLYIWIDPIAVPIWMWSSEDTRNS